METKIVTNSSTHFTLAISFKTIEKGAPNNRTSILFIDEIPQLVE